jgi:ribosomal protein S24E
MILLKRDLPLMSQEDIGYDLGLTVPKEDKKLFKKVRAGKKPNGGWGTQIEKETYSINHFFKKHKINLKEEYVFLNKPEEIKRFLKENLEKKDIIACFDYKTLYGTGESTGHVSIVESVKGNDLVLIETVYREPKYRKVSLSKLSKAIEKHGKDKSGGFWIISDK